MFPVKHTAFGPLMSWMSPICAAGNRLLIGIHP